MFFDKAEYQRERFELQEKRVEDAYYKGISDANEACALIAEKIARESEHAVGVAMLIAEEIRKRGKQRLPYLWRID